MPNRILTAGYHGRTVAELIASCEGSGDWRVWDIRFNPVSRWQPEWSRYSLERALASRYCWHRALGNVRYKQGPPVELFNQDAGIGAVRASQAETIILLCCCRDFDRCHRSAVSRILAAYGTETSELEWRSQIDAKDTH